MFSLLNYTNNISVTFTTSISTDAVDVVFYNTEHDINIMNFTIPSEEYSTKDTLSKNLFEKLEIKKDNGICAICLEKNNISVELPCKHCFHENCASEWLLNHSKLCPMCKGDVEEKLKLVSK